ncbi:Oidioi.mRNA.OKI2018_I69.chr1.g1811.t3.cds [Oikopleura dioica]|uniref:Oidioi.mRNA.OKI2018_I69.chr1.g1811.t3.cds n=1 Tax=Oikopleura dioica TaxID=34765 RepID=A0ABN7SY82_OIKDI|nr:Oidioi.mRNA.OKI2018_I69.chr1.g1811.t3.cds [Oikopleura dioica]
MKISTLMSATVAAQEGCLIMEEAANGWKSLTSPDYPKKFNPNAECVYRITAPENERIELEFVDFLLFNNQIEDCAAQSLTIRDPLSDSPIGKYCGNTKPPNYTTMGNSLFMVLDSNTDGEYKGFHIKYRIHGSSPKMAVEAAASENPRQKLSKGGNMKSQREARPGEFGAKVLAAAKHLSLKNAAAAASEKGEIEAQLLTQNEVNHRRRRQVNRGYGGPRGRDYNDYQYGSTPYGGRGGRPAAPSGPKCRPGFPCPGTEYNPDTATSSSTKREIRCVGANCKKAGSGGNSNLIHGFVWVIVIGVFGAIGWYIYKTYFMEDEEAKKKAEEDEKRREAEGNIGAATLAAARGIGGAPAKGFDAPPRYESWQDHAQPISEAK